MYCWVDLEYRKYAIFLGIVLIVEGTIACGEKDTVSEKDRIKDIEVYDDGTTVKLDMFIWILL